MRQRGRASRAQTMRPDVFALTPVALRAPCVSAKTGKWNRTTAGELCLSCGGLDSPLRLAFGLAGLAPVTLGKRGHF